MTARIGSLFSGYGGLDLGVSAVLDASPAWHAEIAPGPARILEFHYPDVPNLGDVSGIDWASVPNVDILTGGFPCQDVSLAGVRKGLAPGTRSGLWTIFAQAIAALRPRLVVIENVPGLLSAPAAPSDRPMESCPVCLDPAGPDALRALGAVLGSLAELGFDAEWGVLSARAVGAAHRRSRIFVLAWPADSVSESDAAESPFAIQPVAPDSPGIRYGSGFGSLAAAGPSVAADSAGIPSIDSEQRRDVRSDAVGGASFDWQEFGDAVSGWADVLGRPAPYPLTESRALTPQFAEWMMGLPAGWLTHPEIGISATAQLKAAGNGVVPQQAAAAVRLLLERAAATYGMEDQWQQFSEL